MYNPDTNHMRLTFKNTLLGFALLVFLVPPLQVLADGGIGVNTTSEINIFSKQATSNTNSSNIKALTNASPKLAEIIAFHIALIAFFIPLSVEMVGRISERYGSSIISRHYKREIIPQLIFYLSISNVLLSVFLIFFSNSVRILDYLSLGIFTITLLLIIAFLRTLYLYLTDIDWVIGKLIRDVKNVI